jgi:hypothetical protein
VKQSRIFSVAVASAAVIGSVVAVSGTANAAINPFAATWVDSADELGVETPQGYPADGWFRGTAEPAGTTTFTPNGVELTGNTQILNVSDDAAADLTDLVLDAEFISSGQATFQVPLFLNPTPGAAGFTTLRPASFGDEGFTADALWVTSQAFGTIPAGTTAPLSTFQAEITAIDAIDPTADAEILAYGFITPVGATSTVQAVAFGDETTYFTPEAAGTLIPETITLSALRTTGITINASGFFPGETVSVLFLVDGAQSADPIDGLVFTAAADGTISGQVVVPADVAPEAGLYNLTLAGDVSGILLGSAVTVTADAVVAPVPVPAGPTAPVAVPVRANAAFTG